MKHPMNSLTGWMIAAVLAGFGTPAGALKTICFPGDEIKSTSANGINNAGTIVGNYNRTDKDRGFIYKDGKYTAFDGPGVPHGTALASINEAGHILGITVTDTNPFLYANGTFTTIHIPSISVFPGDLNNADQICGGFDGFRHGFIYDAGKVTTIDVPGASYTYATGINDAGQVVGTFVDAKGNNHGFLDDDGHFTTIDVPGAAHTGVYDINNAGQILGQGTPNIGFIYTDGRFSTFNPFADDPDRYWSLSHINDVGQIVGSFEDPDPERFYRGFVFTIPEPSSLVLLSSGLVGLALAGLRKNRSRAFSDCRVSGLASSKSFAPAALNN